MHIHIYIYIYTYIYIERERYVYIYIYIRIHMYICTRGLRAHPVDDGEALLQEVLPTINSLR